MQRKCPRHDLVQYKLLSRGLGKGKQWRCIKCLAIRKMRVRRNKKALLVRENGGKCIICQYEQCLAALDFHHVDKTAKSFGICEFLSRSLEKCRAEAAKCVILCKNCHTEYENGFIETVTKLEQYLSIR
jgi:hypothetical protein